MGIRGLCSVLLAACILLLAPAVSHATWAQSFCGIVLAPGTPACGSNYPHSLVHSVSWYPGLSAHHVKTCTYIWNLGTNQIRGGVTDCRWSDSGAPYPAPASVAFGPTSVAQYRAWVWNHSDTCCNHTINGYTNTD
jgi:hypothetical protein